MKLQNIDTLIKFFCNVSCLFFLLVSSAWANIGVPMIVVIEPFLLIAFIPVVIIECVYLKKHLPFIPFRKALYSLFVANLVSAIVGLPVLWVLWVSLMILFGGGSSLGIILDLTVQAAWLLPYESELYWMVPVALIVFFIPAYFVSAVIEARIAMLMLEKFYTSNLIKKETWVANFYSYCFLLFVAFSWLIFNLKTRT